MTNYEKIKAMSIDEMAEFFEKKANICETEKPCGNCINAQFCGAETKEDFKQWLKSAVN